MAERKVKCLRCGKWFKAADYRHTLCPSCSAAERAKKALTLPAPARRPAAATPAPVAAEQPGRVALLPASPVPATITIPFGATPTPNGGAAPAARTATAVKTAAPVRRPMELSPEQRHAVEARYLELAEPREYDGIRGQIADELKLPKTLVKRAVNDLRQRLGRPSWWDTERSAIPSDVLENVKGRYLALLAEQPLPPVGIHRQLAEALGLSSLQVYRAIGRIRADLGLPKFNERPEEVPEAAETQPAQAS
jgi:hypothetical protein